MDPNPCGQGPGGLKFRRLASRSGGCMHVQAGRGLAFAFVLARPQFRPSLMHVVPDDGTKNGLPRHCKQRRRPDARLVEQLASTVQARCRCKSKREPTPWPYGNTTKPLSAGPGPEAAEAAPTAAVGKVAEEGHVMFL